MHFHSTSVTSWPPWTEIWREGSGRSPGYPSCTSQTTGNNVPNFALNIRQSFMCVFLLLKMWNFIVYQLHQKQLYWFIFFFHTGTILKGCLMTTVLRGFNSFLSNVAFLLCIFIKNIARSWSLIWWRWGVFDQNANYFKFCCSYKTFCYENKWIVAMRAVFSRLFLRHLNVPGHVYEQRC